MRTTLLPFLVVALAVATALISQPSATSANPLIDVSVVAAGGSHTCAVTATSGVKCWGLNKDGQLGDGTTTTRRTPADVEGLGTESTVAPGGFHTCALSAAGAVKCWGNNFVSQLGDGTNTGRSTPLEVSDLGSQIATIAVGFNHSCALTDAGGVKCWGWNVFGQLGDGTMTDRSAPVDVVGLSSGVAALATGDGHTCALTATGRVKCWGLNTYGALGGATTGRCSAGPITFPCSTTPLDVVELTDVTALAAGTFHTCALTSSGSVTCWGQNTYGQLGDGTTEDSVMPVDVSGLPDEIGSISAGSFHTCTLAVSGGLKCWGYNFYGQLGDSTTIDRTTPVSVFGLSSGIAAVAAGNIQTCALTTEGGLKCWGYNRHGQLGDGTNTDRSAPVDVMSKPPSGDVNCDENVDSIDSAMILQFSAGLVDSLACQDDGDVNGSGDINSIDAAIVLQFVAGLISQLPV